MCVRQCVCVSFLVCLCVYVPVCLCARVLKCSIHKVCAFLDVMLFCGQQLEIILAVKTSWGNVECIGFEVFSRLMKAVRSFIVGQPENELKSQEGRA